MRQPRPLGGLLASLLSYPKVSPCKFTVLHALRVYQVNETIKCDKAFLRIITHDFDIPGSDEGENAKTLAE